MVLIVRLVAVLVRLVLGYSCPSPVGVLCPTLTPTDYSLLKLLFLAMRDITAKWYGKPHNWG